MFTTLQDRNLVSFSVYGGFTLHQPLPAATKIFSALVLASGGTAPALRPMTGICNSLSRPCARPCAARRLSLEAIYQVQVLPSWQIQPDLQHIVNPAGGIAKWAPQRKTSVSMDTGVYRTALPSLRKAGPPPEQRNLFNVETERPVMAAAPEVRSNSCGLPWTSIGS
jgi:hypothetical protein